MQRAPPLRLPPELCLMAACCRWPPSPAREDAVRTAASEAIDWDGFEALVARHRVGGQVHDGLKRAGVTPPAPLAQRLADEAAGIAMQNLDYARECVHLGRLLAGLGVDYLVVKGITLNILAYGTLALKQSCDIDLLVDPESYEEAVDLMLSEQYDIAYPPRGATRQEILDWARAHKDTIWHKGRIRVELHHSLGGNPPLVPGLSVRSPRQMVAVAPGMELPTLAKDELFAFLCAHGAAHGWARLKWLADIGALIAGESDAEIVSLHRRSVELGGGRSADQALLLCARLFGTRLPPKLESRLAGDLANRVLVRLALKTATRGGFGRDLDELVLGTVPIHFSFLLLDRGWAFKVRQLGRSLFGGGDDATLARRLPRALLYVPRWLLRRARTSAAIKR